MKLTNDIPAAGHLGQEKTLARILSRFLCPGVHHEVKNYCSLWSEGQFASPPGVSKAPLVLLPVVGVHFKRVALDLVGPLLKNNVGFRYILVLMDYATCFPEAVPL